MFIKIQLFAHKKGTGSSHNGRESAAKRLGPKRADGQFVLAGNILVRSSSAWARTGNRSQSTQTKRRLRTESDLGPIYYSGPE